MRLGTVRTRSTAGPSSPAISVPLGLASTPSTPWSLRVPPCAGDRPPCSAPEPATVGSGVAMPRSARPAAPDATVMTRGMVALFAVSCGVSAANLYYAQPLLASISAGFRAGAGRTALVVTAAQVGYGLGLALLVPLGDLLVRRRLVPVLLAGAAVSLAASALAPDLAVLAAAVAVTGVCSVAAQVLVPFAATLAAPERRGRVVGTVMSGLLLGILLARTVSGLVAELAGWRTVYAMAAGVVSVLAAVLARRLPGEEARPPVRYGRLLASVVGLVRTEPLLRLRSALGALVFATFSVLWTSLAFLLAGPPYHYGEAVIGLFGLLGAAGALAAAWSGRLADRGLEPLVSGGHWPCWWPPWACSPWAATAWPRWWPGSSSPTWPSRPSTSRTNSSSSPSTPGPAPASTPPTWSSTSSAAPSGRPRPARPGWPPAGPAW